MPLFYKISPGKLFYILIDSALIATSWALAILLSPRSGGLLNRIVFEWPFLVFMLAIYLCCLYLFQVYRVLWRYSHSRDFARIVNASIFGCIIFSSVSLFAGSSGGPAEYILSFLLVFILVSFYRLLERDRGGAPGAAASSRKILVVGAGEAGRLIVSEFYNRKLGPAVAAFADDDSKKIGKIINGKIVLGPLDRLPELVRDYVVNEIIVAMPSVAAARTSEIIGKIKKNHPDMTVKTLPPITRIFDNLPLIPDLMDSSLSSLLEREEFELDLASIQEVFAGKCILITGAGGSIGSELCKQALKFGIKKLVAVGKGEHSIYTLVRSLNEYAGFFGEQAELVFRVADVRDRAMMNKIFSEEKPDIVFHAAAHKHVPLMEYNESEALRNNVCGTRTLLDLCVSHAVGKFVLVSTDKAVNPGSIMGASKRVAELTASLYHREHNVHTAVVRFGNVLGSRGSVVPLFLDQISHGGPVTVTHPDMTRFFMSIPEAALLVINAAALSSGGETFVLDMGAPYNIARMAEKLIRMHGLEPGREIMIEYTGLRPGEKLHEELFYSSDDLAETGNKKIHVLKHENAALDGPALVSFIDRVQGSGGLPSITELDPRSLREEIRKIIPEYSFSLSDDATAGSTRLVF
ncbi:MAG TPA: nucleoside-diphosphate sugar epimerase/dehydratase [Spirochaetota bacterium]|nr:nucleoside-diphosphate sugar epimerase/dehydratase [Spirochaetota bacterium]HPI90177.1 nucleoside-diphosphate sugar epimerase/dehydratase [Spirochaetota bacterium]HPR49616.1 nucleoside-diphosphate sugar epimerase/dehydratase [Spirochaetota bacterium]